jgi:NAD+ synthase (glutamine-hydrolysing)
MNQVPLDWDGNLKRITVAIEEARQRGVQLLCLPELCITGYGCEDAFHGPEICETAASVAMREVAPLTRGMVVSVGLPVLHRCGVYNAALLFVDGRAVGLSAKGDLAGDGVHYEPRWFKPWPRASTGRVTLDGTVLPIGDLVYELDGIRLGFEICEEAWVAHRVGAVLAHRAVDVVLNPSASHFAFGKDHVRERFVLEGSRAFGVTYLMANLVGNEAGRLVYDGGNRIASAGGMLARGPRLHFAAVSVTDAVVDVDLGRSIRARTASFRANPTKDDTATVRPPFVWPDVKRPVSPPLGPFVPEEKCLEFTRAIALCLFDYTRKSWCRGWVVSLSGGADSAAVASLCAHAIGLAAEELGIEAVWKTFAYALGPPPAEPTVEDMIHRMLTTVYQGTIHSSDTTRSAAVDVAQGLGCRHVEWEVDLMVEACTQRVAAALGRELSWQTDDIAMQNIQARVRSPGVWMLANAEGKLLLATSNRSEAAVGYATMDGDTSGGLSPIAGIDKAFLRAWLNWMETTGTPALGPLPALRAVNVQQPTAELRPQEMKQTDEDDLMPYPVLDEIERLAIRDKYTPVSVFRQLQSQYPATPVRVVGGWVTRFFRLWCRNQWKRERYAPGFHVDDKNLDPRTWCRFPILSSGFKRELAELEHLVESLATGGRA